MDPKSTTLDPKLKEVYDRVMGTSTNGAPSSPAAAQPSTPVPASNPAPAVAPQPQPQPQAASTPTPFPPPKSSLEASGAPKSAVDYAALAAKYATPAPPIPEAAATPAPTAHIEPVPTSQVASKPSLKPDSNTTSLNSTIQVPTNAGVPTTKNSSSLLKIALIVGVPIFLIAYTVIWVMVFKVDLMSFIPGA